MNKLINFCLQVLHFLVTLNYPKFIAYVYFYPLVYTHKLKPLSVIQHLHLMNCLLLLHFDLTCLYAQTMRPRHRTLMELPEEILNEIFLRMPARSVLICKCVCKPFLRIIRHPDFVNTHLNRVKDVGRDKSEALILHFGKSVQRKEVYQEKATRLHSLWSCDVIYR